MIKKYIWLLLAFWSFTAAAQTPMATRVVKDSLFIPWEILWGPDNHIWMTQKNGYICRLDPVSKTLDTVHYEASTVIKSEGGMLGMALHPQFGTDPYVYVAHNYLNGSIYEERILRFTYDASTNSLGNRMIMRDGIPAANIHNGCRLLIVGDKLFYTVGDAAAASNAQSMSSLSGKIHRINLDGTVPADNPVPGSTIWSLGHRNPQGMVMVGSKMFISEHGNTSDDEINVIAKGRNYGWPNVEGWCNTPAEQSFCTANNVHEPAIAWTPTLAVCGLDYYTQPMFPELQGKLIMATLKDSKLYALSLNAAADSVTKTEVLLNSFGRLRDVCISPAGRIFVSTSKSNSSGSGPFVDQIIEITNPNAATVPEPGIVNVELFPNPAGRSLTVRHQLRAGTYRILGMDGRLLGSGALKDHSQQLDIQTLPAGMYMLQLQDAQAGTTAVRRFVHQQ